MASYFVSRHALPDGMHAVHDRSRCPPGCFPAAATGEYLGEFLHPAQAIAVARLRYAPVRGCACCDDAIVMPVSAASPPAQTAALLPARP